MKQIIICSLDESGNVRQSPDKFYLIKRYPQYEINISGIVRNIKRNKIKGQWLYKGYQKVPLYDRKDKKQRFVFIHRLVAIQFIPNPKNKPEVNHKDGNKLNNHVSNLEWVTAKENSEHSVRMGLFKGRGETSGKAKYTEKQIVRVKDLLKDGLNNREIYRITGVHEKTVSHIRIGDRWCHIQ